ncbi:DNA glycosylase [Aspergillus aurantiobrunneus]
MNPQATKRVRRVSADVETPRRATNCQSIPDEVQRLLEDMDLSAELLLSDSTLSDVPSDLDSIPDSSPPLPPRSLFAKSYVTNHVPDGGAETSFDPVEPVHCAVSRSEREQTPPQLDLSLNAILIPEKKPRLKPTKTSPYFQGPLVNEDSCLPFPPIHAPDFGLVQEQLAHDPFRLLLATIFLNRTRGGVALPILFQVFDRYPTIDAMAAANPSDLTGMINRLGFQNQRARKCIALAQTWLDRPPCRGKRYRKLNYPRKSDGRDVRPDECIEDDDHRVAWEIAHLPGVGAYALDSWRIFCRDELRGLSKDWQGDGATTAGFTPEWKSVLPQDKELRAYLTWMWLKEGWVWDRETGERTPASEKVMRAARRGATAHIEAGNWVLETSPVKRK